MIVDDVFIGLIAINDPDFFIHNKDIFTYTAETEQCSTFLKFVEFLSESLNTTVNESNIRTFFKPYLEERGITGLISGQYIDYTEKVFSSKLEEATVKALRVKLSEQYGIRKIRSILANKLSEVTTLKDCEGVLSEIEAIYYNPVISGSPSYIDYFDSLGSRYEEAQKEEYMKVIPTGYVVLDEFLKIRAGHITTVLATAKTGKSTLLRSIAANQVRLKYNVGYASLEENAEEVQVRFDSNFASEELCATGMKQKDYIDKILVGSDNPKQQGLLHIKYYPATSVKIDQIFTDLKKSGLKMDIFYVDYPFLAQKEDDNSYANGDIIFSRLRYWANYFDFPVMVAHQQGRKAIDNIFAGEGDTGDSYWVIRHSYNCIFMQQNADFRDQGKMKYKIVQRFGKSHVNLISDTDYAVSKFPNMQRFDMSMLVEDENSSKRGGGNLKLGGAK